MSREIQVYNGGMALIDDEDYHIVSKYKWYRHNNGYVIGRIKGQSGTVLLHRLIMGFAGKPVSETGEVDHCNGVKTDCRKQNLRVATRSQNCQNSIYESGVTGYRGVVYIPATGRYKAQISAYNSHIHLGYYDTPEQAAMVYNKKAVEVHGDFAVLNTFPVNISIPPVMVCRPITNTSGFTGVCRHGSKWQAYISEGGKRYFIGTFTTAYDAAKAWDAKARELRGPNTRLNFPFAPPPDADRRLTYDRVDSADLPANIPIRVPV